MRASSFAIFLLLPLLPTACAQRSSSQSPPLHHTSLLLRGPSQPGLNCPIDLFARRQSASELIRTGSATHPHSGQGVHLSIQYTPAAITSAEVVVHAASNKPRILPLDTTQGAPDIARSFHLAGPSSLSGLRASDLWLDGAASILSVDLLSLTYADGTTWTRSPISACRAIPSGFLLIDTQPDTP